MQAAASEREAFEHLPGREDAPVLLTCEHASQRLPDPWRWSAADRRLVGTHWAYDIGAAPLTRELAAALGAEAVLSRFTRLLADPNRPEDEPSLFLDRAEGAPVELNREIAPADRERRIRGYWAAYHEAVDRAVASSAARVLLAVHTFTPVYHGERRSLEVGVLYDADESLAEAVAGALEEQRFRVALNEPYSGKEGLIYAADRHARRHGRGAVEIELRQDLAVKPPVRRRVLRAVAAVLGDGRAG